MSGIGMGIFDNSALAEHDQVTHRVGKEGVALSFACRGCAMNKEMLIEWPEIISLKYGIDPALAYRNHPNIIARPTRYEFKAEDGGWVPDERCTACDWRLAIVIGPDEPERWLAIGRRNGAIHPQAEQQLSQFVSGIANAARQQMARAQIPQRVR
jgi:hypothetical protein